MLKTGEYITIATLLQKCYYTVTVKKFNPIINLMKG